MFRRLVLAKQLLLRWRLAICNVLCETSRGSGTFPYDERAGGAVWGVGAVGDLGQRRATGRHVEERRLRRWRDKDCCHTCLFGELDARGVGKVSSSTMTEGSEREACGWCYVMSRLAGRHASRRRRVQLLLQTTRFYGESIASVGGDVRVNNSGMGPMKLGKKAA